MTISTLIVDDHAGFRASARVLLEMDGFEVIGEAADGAAARAAAERLRPELVLLDVQLPDVLGYDLTRELLTSGWVGHVVLVSSRDEADYGDSIQSSGAAGFVPKGELSGDRVLALLPAQQGLR